MEDKYMQKSTLKNKKAFDTKTMLVDFSGDDEENKGKKVVWEYVAVNEKGKKIKETQNYKKFINSLKTTF